VGSAVGTMPRRMLRVLDVSAEFAGTIFGVNYSGSGIVYRVYIPHWGVCCKLIRDWMNRGTECQLVGCDNVVGEKR
jgi:hypothetical protein